EIFPQRGVGRPRGVLLQIVTFEHGEAAVAARLLTAPPQLLDGAGEQAAHPLAVEVLLRIDRVDRSDRTLTGQFFLGAVEVERQGRHPAAPLEALRRAVLIDREAVQAGAEEGPEARPRRIVAVEGPLL